MHPVKTWNNSEPWHVQGKDTQLKFYPPATMQTDGRKASTMEKAQYSLTHGVSGNIKGVTPSSALELMALGRDDPTLIPELERVVKQAGKTVTATKSVSSAELFGA